jgi:flagellar biosynthesis protein FlhA
MDGASKFVRGDAIAGILITMVNILGGLAIGVLQLDMLVSDAAQTYTILTIGDGLVSQIPALITSISAGLIVTRSTSEDNLASDLARELTSQPRAIFVASGVLFAFAMVPGLPATPFLILAAASGLIAFTAQRSIGKEEEEAEAAAQEDERPEEKVEDYLHVDPLEIQIGYGLIPLVDPAQGGDLLDRVRTNSSIARSFSEVKAFPSPLIGSPPTGRPLPPAHWDRSSKVSLTCFETWTNGSLTRPKPELTKS